MASPKDCGPRKNKRKWKEEEDDALIEVLKDLVNGGTSFKADNGFKPGWKLHQCIWMEPRNKVSGGRERSLESLREEPSGVEASSAKSGNLGKWVRASDNLVKGLSEVTSILGREIRAASSNISRAIGFDVELSEKHSKLNEELANLGLTTMERHRAARKIASEPVSVDVFFSIPDAERKEWVQALLRGDI
ncbi:hypothetical protein Cgig2_012348 [Carnegiea gigantea]|uniref:Uncharacterized protein n=1 Tax=Carnegiea gigantea TaxID=171969 RepID=A0A9Q1KNE8_9CARY|nr:hypothetical protein Cgig2_012348 [Carnegiea gigantea]